MKTKLLILFLFAFGMVHAQSVRDFTLEDVNKEKQEYQTLKGEKLTIIDFWASWCKPCLKSMPKLEALYQANVDKGVNFIGLNCDGPRSISKVAPLTKALKISYPVLTDINNSLMKDLEIGSLPTLLIVDSQNRIVYRHEGFAKGDEKEIQHAIDKHLGKL